MQFLGGVWGSHAELTVQGKQIATDPRLSGDIGVPVNERVSAGYMEFFRRVFCTNSQTPTLKGIDIDRTRIANGHQLPRTVSYTNEGVGWY